MAEILFTTIDVAKMLFVDKSTVKRWTDEGKLQCFRTPGGHRKFRAEDLYEFMTEYHYGVPPADLYPQLSNDESVVRRIIHKKEFHVLASVCFNAAIKGKKDDIVKLFSETHKNGLSVPALLDAIVMPTVKRIIDLVRSGKLGVGERALAVNALSQAIILLTDIIIKPRDNGRRVVCGTLAGDMAEITLRSVAVLLESIGFDVLNLGIVLSAESVIQLIRSQKPRFVFLHAGQIASIGQTEQEMRLMYAELQITGGKLILSGEGFSPQLNITNLSGSYDQYCRTFQELAAAVVEHP